MESQRMFVYDCCYHPWIYDKWSKPTWTQQRRCRKELARGKARSTATQSNARTRQRLPGQVTLALLSATKWCAQSGIGPRGAMCARVVAQTTCSLEGVNGPLHVDRIISDQGEWAHTKRQWKRETQTWGSHRWMVLESEITPNESRSWRSHVTWDDEL